jgi:hypothetical protein
VPIASAWTWFKSDASLPLRIAAGAVFFVTWALFDLRRHGRRATRWREYLFLLAAVAVAMTYGVINDQITSRLSWEYFYYGKGLDALLGPRTPPDLARLSWEAAKIGMKATWTVGLIIGVALLIANNPSLNRPRLRYAQLITRMLLILLCTIAFAVALGAAGGAGWFPWLLDDAQEILHHDHPRVTRFLLVYGIHLGGYAGGLVGTIAAVISIRRQRHGGAGFQPAPESAG